MRHTYKNLMDELRDAIMNEESEGVGRSVRKVYTLLKDMESDIKEAKSALFSAIIEMEEDSYDREDEEEDDDEVDIYDVEPDFFDTEGALDTEYALDQVYLKNRERFIQPVYPKDEPDMYVGLRPCEGEYTNFTMPNIDVDMEPDKNDIIVILINIILFLNEKKGRR